MNEVKMNEVDLLNDIGLKSYNHNISKPNTISKQNTINLKIKHPTDEKNNSTLSHHSQINMPKTKHMSELDQIIHKLPHIPQHIKTKFTKIDPKIYKYHIHHPDVKMETPKPLALQNAHPRDKRIAFWDDKHLYFVDSKPAPFSSTKIISSFFKEFDPRAAAIKTFQSTTFKKKVNQEKYEFYGCTCPEEIEQIRNKASTYGTQLHNHIEDFINKLPQKAIREVNIIPFQQFLKLYNNHYYWNNCGNVFRTEWYIFDEETGVPGAIDIVWKKEDGTLVLGDWKRSKGFNTFSFDRDCPKGYGCCSDLTNCNVEKYYLQLNLYKYILEKNYGEKVSKMLLFRFHPNIKDNEPDIRLVPDKQEKIKEILATFKLCRLLAKK